MITCTHCAGFIPEHVSSCPHCDVAVSTSRAASLAKRAGKVVAVAATAMTLMACYGGGEEYATYTPPTDIGTVCQEAAALQIDNTILTDTYSYGAGHAISLACSDPLATRERVFSYTAASAGTLGFEWNADNPVSVGVRDDCQTSAELECVAPTNQGNVTVDVLAGDEIHIIVEAPNLVAFDYTASFTPAP